MKTLSVVIAVLLMAALLTASAAAIPAQDDNQVFDSKAKELVAGKTARLDKLAAVHAFVRDSIRQVETQFG